jgi:hypothetical protein
MAAARKLSSVKADTLPRRRPGRPKTKLTSAVDDDSPGGRREMLVLMKRKAAQLVDSTKSASAAERLMVQVLRYDDLIRALDAEAAEAAQAEADAAVYDDEPDESFDADAI